MPWSRLKKFYLTLVLVSLCSVLGAQSVFTPCGELLGSQPSPLYTPNITFRLNSNLIALSAGQKNSETNLPTTKSDCLNGDQSSDPLSEALDLLDEADQLIADQQKKLDEIHTYNLNLIKEMEALESERNKLARQNSVLFGVTIGAVSFSVLCLALGFIL